MHRQKHTCLACCSSSSEGPDLSVRNPRQTRRQSTVWSLGRARYEPRTSTELIIQAGECQSENLIENSLATSHHHISHWHVMMYTHTHTHILTYTHADTHTHTHSHRHRHTHTYKCSLPNLHNFFFCLIQHVNNDAQFSHHLTLFLFLLTVMWTLDMKREMKTLIIFTRTITWIKKHKKSNKKIAQD